MTGDPRLVPYDGTCARQVVAWCAGSPYSRKWVPAGATDPDGVLAAWHADPDNSGHVLVRAGGPVAYGELWVEPDEDEAEPAHLVVDPTQHRQGLGRALATELVAVARALPISSVFLRVHPDNAAALATYATVGFVPVSPEDEATFNAGQPAAYRWMRHDEG